MYWASLFLLSALGVSAAPSGHHHARMHRHGHGHEERDINSVVVTATINDKVVTWLQGEVPWIQAIHPTPTPSTSTTTTSSTPTSTSVYTSEAATSSEAAAATTTASSAYLEPTPSSASSTAQATTSSSSSSSGAKAFCGGNTKRASLFDIHYVGNIGVTGSYGCNMMLVDSPDDYDYTMQITNKNEKSQMCACWLKIGPDGDSVNGFFHTPLTWTLGAGETQTIAFQDNTQGGCGCNTGDSLLKTFLGQNAPTYLEFDYSNDKNGGWSGADASSLVASSYDMEITPAEICWEGTCSKINSDGSGHNAFVAGTAALDGLGINAPPGVARFMATVS